MLDNRYRYVLEMFRQSDGSALGVVPVEPDWEPVQQWVQFAHLRRSQNGGAPLLSDLKVEPVWSEKAGAPYVTALRLAADDAGTDLTVEYFRPLARAASGQFIEQGKLKDGDLYTYVVTAYPRQETGGRKQKPGLLLEEEPDDLPVKHSRLDELAQRGVTFGEQNAEDVAVFLPQRVLDEAADLTRRAGALETGGILIGHLHRDAGLPDLFVEVTAQIPAEHTKAATEKLTFMPATWTAVQSAIRLRRAGEIMLGWWHSHPAKFWCSKDCPPEKRRNCPLTRNFFSADDTALHQQVFPKAYSVALVATHTDAGIQYAMFGWRRALVAQRGFHVLTQEGERHHAASRQN